MTGIHGSAAGVPAWMRAILVLMLGLALVIPGLSSAQQDEPDSGSTASESAEESDEDEDDGGIEENVFIPSEEISQDNAVPFPTDI